MPILTALSNTNDAQLCDVHCSNTREVHVLSLARSRTSAGKTAVAECDKSAVPVIGKPNFSVTGRVGSRVGSDHELYATEPRQVVHIDGLKQVGDVHRGVHGIVSHRVKSNVRLMIKGKRRAGRFIKMSITCAKMQKKDKEGLRKPPWAVHSERKRNTVPNGVRGRLYTNRL